MGHAIDAQTIRQRFETEFGALSPAIEYTFGDVDGFTPPEDAAWVRLHVLSGDQRQVGMGKYRRFRRIGLVEVQIFVPAGSGDGLAREIADSVADIFEGRTVSGVIFRGTGLNRVGVTGAWVQWNCSTPYQADSLVLNPTA
jgi:hypothetical protein